MVATLVVGLGFGDEGKGTTVDYLVRRDGASGVVRYGGGPQATHHVVLPDGRWHGFSQFGAGTFVPGVATHLTRDVLVEPVSLLREDEVLRGKGVHDAMARLTIDPGAALVLPYHKMTGQLAELARGGDRHGTVGLGVGEAARERDAGRAITLANARDGAALRRTLAERIAERLAHAEQFAGSAEADERLAYFRRELDVERIARIVGGFVRGYASALVPDDERLPALRALGPVILEGAQGILLDPTCGFPPFITKTPATPPSALAVDHRLGVMRAYAHRHGPGPLPTEDAALVLPEAHNTWNRWQGAFRVGPLDLVLARYAVRAARVDSIALTCLDRVPGEVRAVTAYDYTGPVEPWFDGAFAYTVERDRVRITEIRDGAGIATVLAACRPAAEIKTNAIADLVASELGVPVTIASAGPTWRDKVSCRR